MKKETEGQKKVRSILSKLNKYIFRQKEIARILVMKGNQRMWVSNPKKIKYWMKGAKGIAKGSLNRGTIPTVRILKVIYQ